MCMPSKALWIQIQPNPIIIFESLRVLCILSLPMLEVCRQLLGNTVVSLGEVILSGAIQQPRTDPAAKFHENWPSHLPPKLSGRQLQQTYTTEILKLEKKTDNKAIQQNVCQQLLAQTLFTWHFRKICRRFPMILLIVKFYANAMPTNL